MYSISLVYVLVFIVPKKMAQVEEEDKTTQTAGESQEVPAKESGKLGAQSIVSQGCLASAASYSSNESSLASGRVDDDESESDFFEPSKEFEDVEHFYRRVSKKLKAQDKVSFTLGVWNLLLTAYCFGGTYIHVTTHACARVYGSAQ